MNHMFKCPKCNRYDSFKAVYNDENNYLEIKCSKCNELIDSGIFYSENIFSLSDLKGKTINTINKGDQMKLPEKILINGIEYKITLIPYPIVEGPTACTGQIKFLDNEILIVNTTEHQRQCITLWHEIIHGIFESYQFNFENEKMEEEIITILSRGIFQVLQDNINNLYNVKSSEEIAEEKELKEEKLFKIN